MPTPKKRVKKTTPRKLDSKQEEVPLSKPEQINIEHLLQQAFLRYKEEHLTDAKHKAKEFSHLGLICEEYLSTYALIGYSLQNEKIVIFNTPTQKDESALVDLLRSTFLEIIQNRP